MAKAPFDEEFQRGLDLWHGRHAAAAVATFAGLAASRPDDWRVHLMLGSYLWVSGHTTESEPHLRRATQLRPTLELASVSLFHVLWELDREDEAFSEMRRFLACGEPAEYRQLIAEWRETGLIADPVAGADRRHE